MPAARQGTSHEARWDEILQAAAEEFYERGFRGARLQDIAARVGLLTGSLYYYIGSKEDLLFALVQSTHRLGLETSIEDADTAASDAPTPQIHRAATDAHARSRGQRRRGSARHALP